MNQETPPTPMVNDVSLRPIVKIGPSAIGEKKAQIRIQKDGDAISTINVVCTCGEEITINCQYTDAP